MKTLLAAAAALALVGGSAAYAQEDHHQGGHNEGAPHGESRAAPAGGGYHPSGGPQPGAQVARPQAAPQYAPQQNGGYRPGGQYARPQGGAQYAPQQYGGQRSAGAPAYQGHAGGAYQGHAQGYVTRPGWGAPAVGGRGPRFDSHYYPRVVDLGRHYQWRGDWYPQRGFYSHRWVYGEFLPFGWFAQDYWVSDYWDYGLPVPPYGYTWVRVGPDVLLINQANGFVAESVYGVF